MSSEQIADEFAAAIRQHESGDLGGAKPDTTGFLNPTLAMPAPCTCLACSVISAVGMRKR
jgi:hypothetical protein